MALDSLGPQLELYLIPLSQIEICCFHIISSKRDHILSHWASLVLLCFWLSRPSPNTTSMKSKGYLKSAGVSLSTIRAHLKLPEIVKLWAQMDDSQYLKSAAFHAQEAGRGTTKYYYGCKKYCPQFSV
jgi:hypothetical protein